MALSTSEFLSVLSGIGVRSLADLLPKYSDARTAEDERSLIRQNLSSLNSFDSIPFHLSVFSDGDSNLVHQSSLALGYIGSKQATRPLLKILRDSPWWHSRMFAAATLMELKDKRAVLPLITAMENRNEDERVRDQAAEALSVYVCRQADRVIPHLLGVADDASVWVRWSVAFALGHAVDARVIPALERLTKDATVLSGGQISIATEAAEALQWVLGSLRRKHTGRSKPTERD